MSGRSGRPARLWRRLLAVAVLVCGVVLGGALPASAHAVLDKTDPADGAAVATAPAKVTLTYSESVGIDHGSVQVLDTAGKRVDTGQTAHGAGDSQVVAPLESGLPRGTYVVTWHVVSADSHPVSGSFAFGVGQAPDAAAVAGVGPRSGSTLVGLLAGVARTVDEAGLVLLIGGTAFLLGLWPAGLRRVGAGRLLWAGWGMVVGAGVVLLLVQGPYGAGLGLSGIGSTFSETVHGRYGWLLLLRLLLLALALPLLRGVLAPAAEPPPTAAKAELGVVAVAVSATVVATGHPGVGGWAWLTTAGQTLHVLGASVWLGGLVVLATMVLRRSGEVDLAAVLPRWSRVAFTSVAVVVVTGTFQALREIDAVPELGATTYGRLLLSKLWFVVVMLALGWWANRFVVRHYRRVVAHAAVDTALPTATGPTGPGPDQIRSLRTSVFAEATAGVAVLVLTALLVNTQPAKTAYAPTYAKTLVSGPLTVQADVAPTRRGPETIHVYAFDSSGRPATVAQISGQLSLPAQSVGPITVPLTAAGTGHAVADGVPVPLAGQWQLRVTVRVNDFDQYVSTFFYRVR